MAVKTLVLVPAVIDLHAYLMNCNRFGSIVGKTFDHSVQVAL